MTVTRVPPVGDVRKLPADLDDVIMTSAEWPLDLLSSWRHRAGTEASFWISMEWYDGMKVVIFCYSTIFCSNERKSIIIVFYKEFSSSCDWSALLLPEEWIEDSFMLPHWRHLLISPLSWASVGRECVAVRRGTGYLETGPRDAWSKQTRQELDTHWAHHISQH